MSVLSKEEAWGNPPSLLPAVWWGARIGACGGRCPGCPLPTHPGSILSSAVTWPLLVGQECQLAVWSWLEVTQV